MKAKQVNLAVSVLFLLASLFLIIFLNFSLVRFLFQGEFSQNLASIEISYVQMAKFWVEGGGLWQPLWYLGYPWHVFYTPLLPFLEVVLHSFWGFDFGQAYRAITAVAYVLVPISLYFFVWQISKSKTGALVAALFYSFVPSIIALIFPEVANDTLSGNWEPRRFAILVRWGEGPHTLALVFLPLFGLFFSRFLEDKKFISLLASGFFLALVFLTNALVVWAAILLFLALVLAEFCKDEAEAVGTIKSSISLAVLTFGLIAFWYNLPFLATFFREGGGVLNNWLLLFPWATLLLLAVATAVFLTVKRFSQRLNGLALTIFWFLMLFAFVFIYYASGEERLEYIPQALRLTTEVDLALSAIVGVVFSDIFLFLFRWTKGFKVLAQILAVVLVSLPTITLAFWGLKLGEVLPSYAKPLLPTQIADITKSAEFKTAKKIESLAGNFGQRVLVPGNYAFWLNYFVPVAQIRGALFQSSTHFWPEHIYYQITNGQSAEITLAWLKIANIGKLVYTTPASLEPYKDFRVPEAKFSAVLKEVARENGDIYFEVPLKNDLLAKIIDFKALISTGKPLNAIDEEPIFAYVAVIEKYSDRHLEVTKISNSHLRIAGNLAENEGILVQQTYDSGWKVKQGGWKVKRDPLDFTVLTSKTTGGFEIDLVYAKPFSVYLGYLITLGTVIWLILRIRKSMAVKTATS